MSPQSYWYLHPPDDRMEHVQTTTMPSATLPVPCITTKKKKSTAAGLPATVLCLQHFNALYLTIMHQYDPLIVG